MQKLNMIPESHRRKSELFIIAMGKLGGRELNASSDIDIIFFSPYKDELGSSATTLAKFEKFWDKVLARFINNLSTITDHGLFTELTCAFVRMVAQDLKLFL